MNMAITFLTQAIKTAPDFGRAYTSRAMAYGAIGETGKAIADYTEAIRIHPDNPSPYGLRGFLYAGLGDDTRAEADFAQVRSLRKSGEQGHSNVRRDAENRCAQKMPSGE